MRNRFLFGIVAFFGALPLLAFAASQITISASLPGALSSASNTAPGAFVVSFYRYALFVSGLLAFGAIVYGGIRYAWARGNPSGESEAKAWIWSALLGLLLLAGAYVILYTINPVLVNLSLGSLPNAPAVTPPATTPTPTSPPAAAPTSTSTCPIPALAPITDSVAQQMEGGATILWASSDPAVQQNLSALQTAYGKFQTAIASVGDSGSVQSAYRPIAYQTHLYQIYQNATKYKIYASQSTNSTYASNAACSSVIAALKAEESKHGVCSSPSQCLVASPSNCSPHVAGIGIDITLSGPVTYSGINAVLNKNNVGLNFKGLANDPVHFQLTNPPAGGCPN